MKLSRGKARTEPSTTAVAGALEETASRISEIVSAADRAVEEIRGRLDAQAAAGDRPNVIDRERIARELTETLLERTEALRSEADQLSRIVDRAGAQLRSAQAEGETVPERFTARTPPPPGPKFEGRPVQLAPGVRLLANQMAVAGSSREEIADRLRAEFGVDDPTAILDDVLEGAGRA